MTTIECRGCNKKNIALHELKRYVAWFYNDQDAIIHKKEYCKVQYSGGCLVDGVSKEDINKIIIIPWETSATGATGPAH